MPSHETTPATGIDARVALLESVGTGVLRYGIVFLLGVFGTAKYFAFEAEGIKPLVEHSPLLSWMLGPFGVQGTSNIIGTIELAIALAIASRPLAPLASAIGSAAGVLTFLVTLSFLFSTPGALSVQRGAPLMKDLVLLGACLATGAEALRAVRARRKRPVERPDPGLPATRVA